MPAQDDLDRPARALLELVQRITGLETSFVTGIDWETQTQEVVFALNTSAALEVPEGIVTDWSDTMCSLLASSGRDHSSDVSAEFPGSPATSRGMQTFFSVPIVSGDTTVGTVCGASRRSVPLTSDTIENVRLLAEVMAFLMATEAQHHALRERAEVAERGTAFGRGRRRRP